MEISPQTFREVEFREKRHGYHPEDVDKFLEEMEVAVQALQNRLIQALERADSNANSQGEDGEGMIRRTLVLAQRTADLAVRESRQEAVAIVAAAQKQAETLVSEARQRARQEREESLAGIHAELIEMEAARVQAQQEVDSLDHWAAAHRARFAKMLQEAANILDRSAVTAPPPASTPIKLPADLGEPAPLALSSSPADDGDDRVLASVPVRTEDTHALSMSPVDGPGELASSGHGSTGSLGHSDRDTMIDTDEARFGTFFDDGEAGEGRHLRRPGNS
jgi:DivIVA domain-containing protein